MTYKITIVTITYKCLLYFDIHRINGFYICSHNRNCYEEQYFLHVHFLLHSLDQCNQSLLVIAICENNAEIHKILQ